MNALQTHTVRLLLKAVRLKCGSLFVHIKKKKKNPQTGRFLVASILYCYWIISLNNQINPVWDNTISIKEKAIMMACKFERVFFNTDLEKVSYLSKQRKQRQKFKIWVLRVPQALVGSSPAAVPVAGKIWKGDCGVYLEETKCVCIQKGTESIIFFFILLIFDQSLYIDCSVPAFKLDWQRSSPIFPFLKERMVLPWPHSFSDLLWLGWVSPAEESRSDPSSNPVLDKRLALFVPLPLVAHCLPLQLFPKSICLWRHWRNPRSPWRGKVSSRLHCSRLRDFGGGWGRRACLFPTNGHCSFLWQQFGTNVGSVCNSEQFKEWWLLLKYISAKNTKVDFPGDWKNPRDRVFRLV